MVNHDRFRVDISKLVKKAKKIEKFIVCSAPNLIPKTIENRRNHGIYILTKSRCSSLSTTQFAVLIFCGFYMNSCESEWHCFIYLISTSRYNYEWMNSYSDVLMIWFQHLLPLKNIFKDFIDQSTVLFSTVTDL